MEPSSIVLVLAAAALHAAWNLVVKGSSDTLVATWAVLAVGGFAGAGVLVVAGLPESFTAPWLVGSVSFHLVYPLALSASYDRTDLSVAYPIARGTAPLFVAVAGVAFLDDSIDVLGAVGLLAVVFGVVALARRTPSRRELVWPLLTGSFIAAYTVFDGGGVRSGDETLRYISAVFCLTTIGFTAIVTSRRGGTAMVDHLRQSGAITVAGGLASSGAYLLVLIAARSNPLGLVAGLRETSAAFAVIGAAVFLGETVTRAHLAIIAAISAGAAMIALSS